MSSLVRSACLAGILVATIVGCGSSKTTASNEPDGGGGSGGNGHGGSGGSSGSHGGSGGVVDPHAIPTDASAGVTMCAELGTWCHPFDHGSGLAHQCHEVGHTGDTAQCAAIFDECSALCRPDAGDAGVVVLGPVCESLATACDPFENDDGGTGHDCHELGHQGDERACIAMSAQCLAVCAPDASDAGPHADGG